MNFKDRIYVCSFEDTQGQRFIKIGITTGDPIERIKNLQTGNPFQITIESIFELPIGKGAQVEKLIHKEMSSYRVSGEWFKMCSVATLKLGETLFCLEKFKLLNYKKTNIEELKDYLSEVNNAMV